MSAKTMRPSILLREPRSLRRGRKPAARSESPAKASPRAVDDGSSYELDDMFRRNAYPGPADIFRISQQTQMSPSAVKAEFQRRRQAVRERRGLSQDAVVHSSALPQLFLLLQALCSILQCHRQLMAQLAVFCLSVFSVWYSVYLRIGRDQVLEHEGLLFLG